MANKIEPIQGHTYLFETPRGTLLEGEVLQVAVEAVKIKWSSGYECWEKKYRFDTGSPYITPDYLAIEDITKPLPLRFEP